MVHAGPVPHWQPSVPQVSASAALHEVQEPPLRPHVDSEAGTQTLRLQQLEPVHELESQTHVPDEQR